MTAYVRSIFFISFLVLFPLQACSQDFILIKARWTRSSEWRAPKSRSPSRL